MGAWLDKELRGEEGNKEQSAGLVLATIIVSPKESCGAWRRGEEGRGDREGRRDSSVQQAGKLWPPKEGEERGENRTSSKQINGQRGGEKIYKILVCHPHPISLPPQHHYHAPRALYTQRLCTGTCPHLQYTLHRHTTHMSAPAADA